MRVFEQGSGIGILTLTAHGYFDSFGHPKDRLKFIVHTFVFS